MLTLYVDLPDTPLRASASDQWLARRFHDDGFPCAWSRPRLLLGSLRRLIRPADAPRLSPIRSLAYFRPVIDELRAHPVPEGYLDYLRLKLRQAIADLPAPVRNSSRTMRRAWSSRRVLLPGSRGRPSGGGRVPTQDLVFVRDHIGPIDSAMP